MSSNAKPLPRDIADRVAIAVVAELAHGCDRIEVAGSLRRRALAVNDIEIVAVPRRLPDLLGEGLGDSCLEPILARLVEEGKLEKIKAGDKFKQFRIVRYGCNLDLFLCARDTWGVNFTIRTGPADFSRLLVTSKSEGGYMPDDLRVADLRIWRGYDALETPEEANVFRTIGLDWIPPDKR